MRSLVKAGRVVTLVSMLAPFAHADVGPGPIPSAGEGPVVLAAGDIAQCPARGAVLTARLLDGLPGIVLAVGDLAYERGTLEEFEHCYEPTWGAHKERTYPVPGNHEYETPDAAGYFAYWGDRAGTPGKGYYSFNLGGWHFIAINGNCWAVGGCQAGSQQERWLAADLAANSSGCTLAYWHQPRFSSGVHHSDKSYEALWQDLYNAHADIVLNGHDHDYELFAPQTPTGASDPKNGIREFVVGTGGKSLYPFTVTEPNSELRHFGTFGVLALTLRSHGYDWRFVPEAGGSFTDHGSGACHRHG
jgi:hypothetical protein